MLSQARKYEMVKSEYLKQFTRARKSLVELVLNYPDDKLDEAVSGEWNIKCVIAHIAGWDTYFTMIAKLLRLGKEVPYRGDRIDRWNDEIVKEQAAKSWNEVQAEFVKAGQAFRREYGNLDQELWNRRFWEQRPATPAWVVKHITEHYKEHTADIEKVLMKRE
jgi:uncharacterized damage-inducible protein DinB